MPKKALRAAATGLPKSNPSSCPVADLARALKALNDIHNRLDQPYVETGSQADYEDAKTKMKALEHHREWIELQARHLPTSSGLGAILQIQIISELADSISVWIPEKSEGANACAGWLADITRIAYSLVMFIEATTGAKAEDASCDYYMPREDNPHLRLAAALAA